MNRSTTHTRYLAALGISEKPSTVRRARPAAGNSRKRNILVLSESDLFKLRGLIFWRFHDDEVREGLTVTIKRGGRWVGRIDCATKALAHDAERICAGIRFGRGAE